MSSSRGSDKLSHEHDIPSPSINTEKDSLASPKNSDHSDSSLITAYESILQRVVSEKELATEDYCVAYKETKYYITCKICGTDILTGPLTKCLTNFKAHLARPAHATEMVRHKDRQLKKQMSQKSHEDKDTQDNLLALKKKKMDEIEKDILERYDGVLEVLKNQQKVMCTFCLTTIDLFPPRGNVECNIDQHLKKQGTRRPC